MRISLEQAASILNRETDYVLYIANNEQRLTSYTKMDSDIIYGDDGKVQFVEGERDPVWEFELDDVLEFKKQMEEGLVGEVESILNGED